MKISELIQELEKAQVAQGDVQVYLYDSGCHAGFKPNLKISRDIKGKTVVALRHEGCGVFFDRG